MSNIAIVFWSGTGNTEAMADAVKAGAQEAGAEVSVFNASDFSADMVADFDAIAFGCPAMGDEVLEEDEFQPMFDAVLPALNGKKVALFGSYGWGDGQWMRDWQESCQNAGVSLACECVIANDAPDDEAVVACKNLGAALV
ncbi:MAG: flavodoxin [Ruminococcus sp.]